MLVNNIEKLGKPNWKLEIGNWKLRKQGFSLTEVIITLSLFLLLAGVGVGFYFEYYRSSLANADVDNALTLIKQARFRALKNPTNSNYGIYIDSVNHSLTTFRDTYGVNNPDNIVLKLEQIDVLNLSLNPNIGTTNEILFEKQTGKTQNTGSFEVGNSSLSYTFNINSQGIVN